VIAVADPEWASARLRTGSTERMRIATENLQRAAMKRVDEALRRIRAADPDLHRRLPAVRTASSGTKSS
jgi:hypothetical protein